MPNLQKTIEQLSLEAGGPGSGRRPEMGSTLSDKRSAYLSGKHYDAKMGSKQTLTDDERKEVVHHIKQGNLAYNSKTGGLRPGSGKVNSRTKMVKNFTKDEQYV